MFLKSDAWRLISAEKRELVKACEDCGVTERLQCHHVEYPSRWEDTTMEQLRVLCRGCHREAHGFSRSEQPDPFTIRLKEIQGRMMMAEDRESTAFPSNDEEVELVKMAEFEDQFWEVCALFRLTATMRVQSRMLAKWQSAPAEIRRRLWPWAERKFSRIEEAV